MEAITTAIGTAITSVTGQLTTAIGDNLPAIFGVAAVFIVVPAVWGMVRRFTH